MRGLLFLLVTLSCALACNALLSIDNYRACEGAECDGSTADAGEEGDGGPGATCSTSADCTAGDGKVVCSNGRCAAVDALAEGSANQSCAVLSDHALWCWGDNSHGQLGRGALGGQFAQPAPVTVVSDPVAQAVVGDDYSCARTTPPKNEVWCWGDGAAAQGSSSGTKVQLPAGATYISGGPSGVCAQLTDGSIYCWGRNDTGNLGCGDAGAMQISPLAPRLLLANANIAHLAVGGSGTCATESGNDTVHCFGNTAWGFMGDGRQGPDDVCQSSVISSFASLQLDAITAGDFAVCARNINGNWFCWGMNYVYYQDGVLWPQTHVDVFATPFELPIATTTQQVSIGWLHTCSLDSVSGQVRCWGESTHGTAGLYTQVANPTVIPGVAATSIAAHRQFTCAIERTGDVDCWGNNQFATVSPTVGTDTPTPTRVVW